MNLVRNKKNWMETLEVRIAFGIAIPIILLIGIGVLYFYGSPFNCVLYQVTGIYCPGCGSGRAAFDLIHWHVIDAIHHNLFFVIAAPVVGYYGLKVYIKFVFRRDVLPFFSIPPKVTISILLVVFVYTILRNIPVYPFTWLAPY